MLAMMLGIGSLAIGVSGYISYRNARAGLTDAALRQLTGIRRSKAQQIESQFTTFRNYAITLSSDRMLIDAMTEFRDAFRKLDGPEPKPDLFSEVQRFYRSEYLGPLSALVPLRPTIDDYMPIGRAPYYLQVHYLARNPYSKEERDKLEDAKDGSQYARVHTKYHASLRRFARQFGYYDFFLIDKETGRVVYSVAKEPDFATSLLRGPYRNTGLARAFTSCRSAVETDVTCLTDFEPYEPSLGAPAAFLASPVMDAGTQVGVLAFQLSIRELDRVASGNKAWGKDGLGRSGDTGIVGMTS